MYKDKVYTDIQCGRVSWINEDGISLSYQFVKYASPLIQGEVEIPHENGLPKFVKLSGEVVERVLPPHDLNA